ncbi:MAG: methyltransferase domain-containing protein [Flavobacteriaceae bacterium]|jgi:hypothetical protein|nr:methyltransferase domain-containing protein [Flavobacteriaceae bacterium]
MVKFIYYNRKLTSLFVDLFNSMFGDIDNCEEVFYSYLNIEFKSKTILELGGTNRPLFSKSKVNNYIGIDIDATFISKDVYHKYFIQSCEVFNASIKADLIVSKYLIEHVPNNSKTFKNIERWLNPNGLSVNLFPLGFHPFSILNRLIGNRMTRFLIPILRPGSEGITGYPAYYNLCNSFDLEKFAKKSNFNYKIKYFFGAEDYFGFFFPFGIIVHILNRIFHLFRLNIFASNAVLIISK